jgi:elongation factor P
MLGMNEIKIGTVVVENGEPYVILSTDHLKMGRGGAVLRTKMRNVISGGTLEISYRGGDKIQEADLTRTKANFLYRDGDDFYFMDSESFEQFVLPKAQIGEISNFVKEDSDVEVLNFDGKAVSINLPAKVELKVTSAPPGVKGDTAQGSVYKPVTVETGYTVQTPLFIKEGDTIRVNTQSGQYVERVN